MKVMSQRGEVLDVSKFMAENPEQIAVGNAKMNARGDIIGPGGKIVKRREDISDEYHRQNPKAVKKVALNDLRSEVMKGPGVSPQEAMKELQDTAMKNKAAAEEKNAPRRRKISESDE